MYVSISKKDMAKTTETSHFQFKLTVWIDDSGSSSPFSDLYGDLDLLGDFDLDLRLGSGVRLKIVMQLT